MGVIPPVIPANTALGETIAALRRLDAAHSGGAERSLRGEIEHAIDLRLSEQGTTCLRTACAARNLTMVVSDPRTGSRHAVPAEYFDRPNADIEFSRGFLAPTSFRNKSSLILCTSWCAPIADGCTDLSSPSSGCGWKILRGDRRPALKCGMRRLSGVSPRESQSR